MYVAKADLRLGSNNKWSGIEKIEPLIGSPRNLAPRENVPRILFDYLLIRENKPWSWDVSNLTMQYSPIYRLSWAQADNGIDGFGSGNSPIASPVATVESFVWFGVYARKTTYHQNNGTFLSCRVPGKYFEDSCLIFNFWISNFTISSTHEWPLIRRTMRWVNCGHTPTIL